MTEQDPPPPPDLFVFGLDLGQVCDPSALAVAHRTHPEGRRGPRHYAIRHLERWPLGTAYPDIVEAVRGRVAELPGSFLVVDATGVGRAVVDLFARAKLPAKAQVPVTTTCGDKYSYADGEYRVAKKILVSVTQALLQTPAYESSRPCGRPAPSSGSLRISR